MESVLTGNKLADELTFFKQQADILATQKLKYSNSFIPPLERRPKRATVANVPLCDPPVGVSEEEPAAVETIKITIKSTKPPLLFQLNASSTSTISALKLQLSTQESTAPPPDSQRWIIKGKAMGDNKLLREFTVEDGAIVNLMVKAGTSTTVVASTPNSPPMEAISNSTTTSIPELRLSSTDTSLPDTIPITSTSTSTTTSPFLTTVSSPELWIQTFNLLKDSFNGDENQAKIVWENWFSASLEWIEPNQKALIREKCGISLMGGSN